MFATAKILRHIALALPFLALSCASEPSALEDNATKTTKTDGRQKSDDKGGGDKDIDSPVDEDTNETVLKISGKSMFDFSLVTAFKANCQTCHADPRFTVETRGPLTIYNYLYMKPFLQEGSSVDNALLRKMLGINHTGGNQCPEGLEKAPCSYVVDWYKTEFGDDGAVPAFFEDTSSADPRAGHISDVSSLGKVFGWAVNKADLTQILTIKLYADGDSENGTLVATQTANREGYDGNHSGHHGFMVELPDSLRDGNAHDLYLYATIAGEDERMAGPISFTAYKYSAAGRAYYSETILPLVAQCKQCHSTTYEGHFANLISPSPAKGATANDNELVNKASGQGHGGGNRCGNGSPCNEFRIWWELEFGD